jgi:hypothetical protein
MGNMSVGRVKFKTQGVLLRLFIVYPQSDSVVALQGKNRFGWNVQYAVRREFPLQALASFFIV